jgi:hypothetical protein
MGYERTQIEILTLYIHSDVAQQRLYWQLLSVEILGRLSQYFADMAELSNKGQFPTQLSFAPEMEL